MAEGPGVGPGVHLGVCLGVGPAVLPELAALQRQAEQLEAMIEAHLTLIEACLSLIGRGRNPPNADLIIMAITVLALALLKLKLDPNPL